MNAYDSSTSSLVHVLADQIEKEFGNYDVGVCSVSAADVFQVDGAPTVTRLNVRWRRR